LKFIRNTEGDIDMTANTSPTLQTARRRCLGSLLLCAAAALPTLAQAQDANTLAGKRLRLVVPFSPGGGVDGLARAVADGLTKTAGVNAIVDNKPGAGGNIAAVYVAKTQNDTLNLLVTSVNHYANPILVANSGYDAYKDFVPISYLSTFPYAFVVPGDSPFNSLADVVAKARAAPGTVSWAFGGNGTLGHFLGIAMEQSENVKGNPVSYRGGPDLLTALGGHQVDMAIMTVQSATPLVKQGRLKALAVSGTARNKVLPNVPAVSEVLPHYPGINGYVALMAPAGTPAPLLAQLHQAVNKVLASDEYTKRLESDGSTSQVFQNLDATRGFFDKDGPQWEALTRQSGLKVE
jgi:tripartite-type tricarboxylate transporter receptor subunit TctC